MLNRLIGLEPSVMRVERSPRDWSSFTWREQGKRWENFASLASHTCISGPAVHIAAMVSDPIASVMSRNFFVSIVDRSRDFTISSSFCSRIYLSSASRACVSLSSSDSYRIGNSIPSLSISLSSR